MKKVGRRWEKEQQQIDRWIDRPTDRPTSTILLPSSAAKVFFYLKPRTWSFHLSSSSSSVFFLQGSRQFLLIKFLDAIFDEPNTPVFCVLCYIIYKKRAKVAFFCYSRCYNISPFILLPTPLDKVETFPLPLLKIKLSCSSVVCICRTCFRKLGLFSSSSSSFRQTSFFQTFFFFFSRCFFSPLLFLLTSKNDTFFFFFFFSFLLLFSSLSSSHQKRKVRISAHVHTYKQCLNLNVLLLQITIRSAEVGY